MLQIEDLHAGIDGNDILRGLDLNVASGEVHAIMGPNGSGKSTLSKVLAGHPDFHVTSGKVLYEVNFKEVDLLSMAVDERARQGIFLAFQYPVEVPGVTNSVFLRAAFNAVSRAQGSGELDPEAFEAFLQEKAEFLDLDLSFMERFVNAGFSGGEKKKNEILQMAVLSPRLAILDETDSGLDVDALCVVAGGVNKLRSEDNAIILITHYERILKYIVPDHVHVLYQGRIIRSGKKELAEQIEEQGYDLLIQEWEEQNPEVKP